MRRAIELSIHPTAIVESGAQIGRDVSIGAYSVVGAHVVLGDGCRLHHHAIVQGHTRLGPACEVFPQAVIGMPPQDLKFQGEKTTLEIGRNNIFREMVTVHPGTGNGGGVTRIGDQNFFLIGVHVAHDCTIGNRCVIANYVQFAGHVHVEDFVNMGGHSAVHHFATIGKHAFVGGMTRVAADVPPFMVVVAARGSRSEIRMINGVGLQRSGYSEEDIGALKDAFMQLFSRRARTHGTPIRDRVQAILSASPLNPHVEYLCKFLNRSFEQGRHGRYLESLRADPVHRKTWRIENVPTLNVDVVGRGIVKSMRVADVEPHRNLFRLTAQAEPGWTFTGWNGHRHTTESVDSIVVEADERVTATFRPQRA